MNLTIEQQQEIIKQWYSSPENIYNFNSLTYPTAEQQVYMITSYEVLEKCKQFQNNPQDLQKNLSPYLSQHKAIIYVMFQAQKYQVALCNLVKIGGYFNIIPFYQELSRFISTQWHLLKEEVKLQIYHIMKLFLDEPLDQFEDCFRSFLRAHNIYLLDNNLNIFIGFLFDQHKKIMEKPNLAALTFYKYLLILNMDDFHKNQNFNNTILSMYGKMLEMWNSCSNQIQTFGRELLINLQIPIQYAEEKKHEFASIKNNLQTKILISNSTISPFSYKTGYQMALPFDIEQKITVAVFHQQRVEMSLVLLLERYGYHINFLGSIIRNLVCGYQFESSSTLLKIAECLVAIYDIAELKEEKFPVFLRFIFSDLFYFTKDINDDHHIQAGIYFLKILHNKALYDELNQTLWFIFQTFESNDQLKIKALPQLLQLSKYPIFQSLMQDGKIKKQNTIRIHEYFLQNVCMQDEDISYPQQQIQKYNIEDLDTPFEEESNDTQNDQYNQNKNSDLLGDIHCDYTIEVDQVIYKILEREKFDQLFMCPQQEDILKRLFIFLNAQFSSEVKELLVQEITKILLKIYEDHFFDIDYTFPFNCLFTLLSNDIKQESALSEIFYNILIVESFSQAYLILGYFESRFYSTFFENYLNNRPQLLLETHRTLQKLLNQNRLCNLYDKIFLNNVILQHNEILFQFIQQISVNNLKQIELNILKLFINNNGILLYLLQKLDKIQDEVFLNYLYSSIFQTLLKKQILPSTIEMIIKNNLEGVKQQLKFE